MRRAPLIVVAVVALSGCGSSSSTTAHTAHTATSSASAPATTSTTAAASSGCKTVAAPAPKGVQHLKAPTLKLDPGRKYTVTIQTNCGAFAFTLDVKQAPKTSASFYALVKRGFYTGLIFHRVVPGFVIQGGDPLGTGAGGPGYTVVEAPPRNTHYVRGLVAMAKTQTQPAGASGSQFFIVTGANAGLPPDYAIVGQVVSGQSVVDAIGALPTNANEMPMPTVVMSSVTVSVS